MLPQFSVVSREYSPRTAHEDASLLVERRCPAASDDVGNAEPGVEKRCVTSYSLADDVEALPELDAF